MAVLDVLDVKWLCRPYRQVITPAIRPGAATAAW
jgi:hypothetical protein